MLAPGVMTRNLSQVNHYVVLGKDADGKVFLYDPYPRVGTQLLRSDRPELLDAVRDRGRALEGLLHLRPAQDLLSAGRTGAASAA